MRARSSGQGPGRRGPGAAARGFTLLEILLALALIALLAGVLISGSAQLLANRPTTPEEVFWAAVQQARASALKTEREVRLSFDPKDQNFVLDDGAGRQVLAVPPTRDLSSVLIGGDVVDTQTIPYATFYTDGTCTPFRVQFRTGGAARLLTLDPWTCARVLPRPEGSS
ncbi:MAG: GspH/FimT family pseudopilin [Opitutales bacterium]|nr:GspH/FimT family pseudopilin [Opitutales bacterium]